MENGISLRRTLSNVPIHGGQSLVVGTSVRRTTLEDWAVVRTLKCSFHARSVRFVLHAAIADCVRSIGLKIMVVDGAWVRRVVVGRSSLRLGVEGFFDTVLGVGSSAREYGAALVSLLARSLSSSRRPGGGRQGCRVGPLVILSIGR